MDRHQDRHRATGTGTGALWAAMAAPHPRRRARACWVGTPFSPQPAQAPDRPDPPTFCHHLEIFSERQRSVGAPTAAASAISNQKRGMPDGRNTTLQTQLSDGQRLRRQEKRGRDAAVMQSNGQLAFGVACSLMILLHTTPAILACPHPTRPFILAWFPPWRGCLALLEVDLACLVGMLVIFFSFSLWV